MLSIITTSKILIVFGLTGTGIKCCIKKDSLPFIISLINKVSFKIYQDPCAITLSMLVSNAAFYPCPC
jgi:hypothetical protein